MTHEKILIFYTIRHNDRVGSASCAVNDSVNISANISVASSAAEGYAEWLTDRPGLVPDNVIMAVGDGNSYGIDMSDFEDDGYIIKNVGGDILLPGKSEVGLDLAVRKYANSADLGRYIEDTVYHEGYRVEKFTLIGRDISDGKCGRDPLPRRDLGN